ncbi:hypothetical protein [Deinococcus hopiensis]|uniref:Uncharacterized protein n=1 Tax=Deinococcus hopiensis KR-140 TaxID=695939 RepID=A0A1W1VJH4_9DEIO|nr:hypothetical protein [Deinococcus hopiensis]SMB93512.1 hypothetical protein SAMN00790413_02016 [Deinococcus hopiensis KR-140]
MRSFGLILLAFVAGVMIMVAAFAWQGRAAREYGREALRAAQKSGLSAGVTYTVGCAELVKRPLPGGVQGCEVEVKDAGASAVVRVEGGRVFRVRP